MQIALTRQFVLLRLLMLAMLMLRETLSPGAHSQLCCAVPSEPARWRVDFQSPLATQAMWVVCNLPLSQVSAGVFPIGRNTPCAQQVKNIP
jgi:hypothetical protein